MNPNRQLDVEIAEQVLGWTRVAYQLNPVNTAFDGWRATMPYGRTWLAMAELVCDPVKREVRWFYDGASALNKVKALHAALDAVEEGGTK